MPIYTCRRCGYSSSIKTHLKKHYGRRHTCANLLNGPSVIECLQELYCAKPNILHMCEVGDTTIVAEPQHVHKNPGSFSAKTNHLTSKDFGVTSKDFGVTSKDFGVTSNDFEKTSKECDSYICPFCNTTFTRKNNMTNHIKNSCKYAAKTYSEDDVSSLLDDKDRQMDDKDRQLKYKDDLLAEMRKQIEVLLTKVGNNNNNNVNIVLNGFGQEDTSYITGKFIKNLLKSGPYKCIPNLIKNIHFHPEHQENHNIQIPNMNKNIAKIYNGDNKRWELQNKTDTLTDMSDKAYDMINEHYDDGTNANMDKFNEDFDDNNPETTKKLKQDIELTILNNQESV